MRPFWIICAIILLIILGVGATRLTHKQPDEKQQAERDAQNRPLPVVAAPVTAKDVPVYLRGLGSVTPLNTVTVKSRVDGQLIQVNVREGQEVKSGDLLAVVDPRPYEVQLHQAEAALAKDQAAVVGYKADLSRYQELVAEKVLAQQQLDSQRSLVGQAEGSIDGDKAAIENAKLQLVYSRITAPVNGEVGLRLVDPGNIVHANDTNGMLVITQTRPITVVFTLPEDNLPPVLQRLHQGSTLVAEAYSRDDKTKLATGKLLTVDNQIDQTTGTDKLKAIFPNDDRALFPNQFVNVRLLLETRKNALTIPAAAVQRGSQGMFVYVVKPDNTVEARTIRYSITEGNLVAVDDGLHSGELVVTDGQDRLQPNAKVEVQKAGDGGRPPAAAPSAGE